MKKYIPILLCGIFCSMIFSLCQKDSVKSQKWKVIDLNYDGELSDMFVINKDTVIVLSYMDNTFKNTVLLQTNDGGVTWIKKMFPLVDSGGFRSIFCLNASIIFASGVHGLYRSDNGGDNWALIGLREQMESGIIYFHDKNNGLVGKADMILMTSDGGSIFNNVFQAGEVMSFKQFQFLNDQIGYASGGIGIDIYNYGIVAKTLDGGNTWKALPEQFQNVLSMNFISPTTGFIVTSLQDTIGAKLLKTSDGGETWISIYNNLYKAFNMLPDCWFEDELNGYIYGWGKILSTNNGGKSWNEEFNGNSMIWPIKMIITQSKNAFVLCQNRYMLKRIDDH